MKRISFYKLFFQQSCLLMVSAALLLLAGCKVSYGFRDVGALSADIKTIKVGVIENKAKYINPQAGQKFTESIQKKIISNTKLTRTNSDDADYVINGYIQTYDGTQTVGVSSQQASTNRLTISVHLMWRKNPPAREVEEFDVTRSFDYSAKLTFQAAEAQLLDEAVRSLTDDIFNKMFSNW